ncbi:phosphatidylserine decarboxylase family protein [candidate division KSB1 bacterium]|nr:phosphatidylserine decarboxylase family protein [candidate division KSB1 bacterium]
MAKEGFSIILVMLVFALILSVGAWVNNGHLALTISAAVMWILFLFTIYFFRDPQRSIPENPDAIISAADGTVTAIEEIYEPAFFDKKVTCVRIFLSIFNVHVNRIPVNGSVEYFDYQRGKFYAAYRKVAAEENEQTLVGIKGEHCDVLVKQIVGAIARRIVCHVRTGHKVTRGDRFGMIKFGSCVEMYMPSDVKISVQKGDKVRGGETIIGYVHAE